MPSETELRDGIAAVGRRLYENKFIAAAEGNISARLGDTLFFTPSATCKGFLNAEDIIKTDLNGRKLSGPREPSSEIIMHLVVYRLRPDVQAVVHAHPPHATAFAVAGVALDKAILPEVILALGRIPLAEYGTPTTAEMGDTIRGLVPSRDALLLSNHGALTLGADLESAYFKMEMLEHFAKVSLLARLLGRERVLPRESLLQLYALRPGRAMESGIPLEGPLPAEDVGPGEEKFILTRPQVEEIIDQAIRRVTGKDPS